MYNSQKGNIYIYFRKYQDPLASKGFGLFETYFQTITKIRKEKLKQLKKLNNEYETN